MFHILDQFSKTQSHFNKYYNLNTICGGSKQLKYVERNYNIRRNITERTCTCIDGHLCVIILHTRYLDMVHSNICGNLWVHAASAANIGM